MDREDDDDYYIVPFSKADKPSARMAIGATNKKLLRCQGISRTREQLKPFVKVSDVIASRDGRALHLPGQKNFILRPATAGIHPVLVWKPCPEPASPLLPFYLVTVGDRSVYVRVDGRLFPSLGDSLPGR